MLLSASAATQRPLVCRSASLRASCSHVTHRRAAWAPQAARRKRPPTAARAAASAAAAVLAAVPPPEARPAPALQGANMPQLVASVALGLALCCLVPRPAAISAQGWRLLSIFLSTVAGLVLVPLPAGAWSLLGVTAALASRTLTFRQAFAGFTDEALWLIVIAFFFSRGFEKTGLGERVANIFVRLFGRSTLGLAYGLSVAEALVAPAMPSATARAGGIFMPVIASLSHGAHSEPNDPSRKKLGAFLVQTQLQASSHSSCMYLTAAAQNLLCVQLAKEGYAIPSCFITWWKAALVPAWAGLLLTPLALYWLFPPEVKDTPDAPRVATERLERMGPMSEGEKTMLCTMLAAVLLWACGDRLGLSAVTTAMMGLSWLLLSGVLQWKDALLCSSAWDTLFWFAVLVGMSSELNSQGVVAHFAQAMGSQLEATNLGWRAAFLLLNFVYFLMHYVFAAQTAQMGALFPAIFSMMLTAGVPGVIAALSLGFTTNLFGAITHFSSGPAVVYYGSGYLSLVEQFRLGAIMGLFNVLVWGLVGSAWWAWLGLM